MKLVHGRDGKTRLGLSVYANCWNQKSACQYYRQRVPLEAMQKAGLADMFIDDPFQDAEKRGEYLWTSGVQLHYLVAGKSIHDQTKKTTEMKPATNALGEMQYPPVIVWDMDDDIEMVNPLNPKYAVLGTRDADGNLLDPEAELGILFESGGLMDGDPVYLWKHDQETVHGRFNAGRNVVNHAHVRKMAATAHAVTCTTPELEKVAKKWNPRTFVYPNSILFDDFHHFDIRRPADDVRVMWQGGYSHFPDFYPIKNAFSDAAHRMPQIKWVVFGTLFPWVYEKIPSVRVEFYKWVSHELFHMKLGTLCADINIAPLANTRFNRCKSAIKWYEAAALKIPTLASNCGPYKEEIVDGETGLLFSSAQEFVDKLEHLVKDADYRKRIGQNAYDWVREHRDAMKTVIPLAEFYRSLVKSVWGTDLAA